jgi:DNA polymerase-3 subunit beta
MNAKFTFEPAAFQKALAQFQNIVPSKTALPILGDIVVGYDKDRDMVWLMASDTESWLKMDCQHLVTVGDETTLQPWARLIEPDRQDPFTAVCIPFRQLKDAISAVPRGGYMLQIWFETNGDQIQMRVNYGLGEFTFPCDPALEFPPMAQVITMDGVQSGAQGMSAASPVCQFTLRGQQLMPYIKQARICCANDEIRPVMNTECLDIFLDRMVLVASNGHTLYRRQFDMGAGWLGYHSFPIDGSAKLLVPKAVLPTICDVFSDADRVTVTADTQRISFSRDGIELVSRLMEGNYPNYESVIPKTNNKIATMTVGSLAGALKRVGLFANEASNMVTMVRQGGELVIDAADIDFSRSGNERVPLQNAAETTLPEGERYGFKMSTFVGLLGCIATENLHLLLGDPARAALIREEDVKSTLTLLVMPMLVNE